MAYSNEELTQRVKQLEDIILTMGIRRNFNFGICVNTSLHSYHYEEVDMIAHPSDLLVPHYLWQPQIDWERDQIHLHPENKPRT